jgi:ATP-dependent RNA helicase RhlE
MSPGPVRLVFHQIMTEFSELGLSPETLQAVADSGYTTATPIQAEAIPVALAGSDILGIAQTGTGKTAAFTLPMIERLKAGRAKARMPRSLVVEPTRELADQVAAAFERYAKGTKLTWALLIGGVSFGDQDRKLDRGVDVLIATPGRLLDHVERGKLLLTGVQIMVVDEADRMLDMGFIPDIERIFKLTPPKKQTLFFSATMPPQIKSLADFALKDPESVEVGIRFSAAETVSHYMYPVASDQRMELLLAILKQTHFESVMIFTRTKVQADQIYSALNQLNEYKVAVMHSDIGQRDRERALQGFRNGEFEIIVATDLAARGLDVSGVTHVINYMVPEHSEDYVHRIGRTGRAQKEGDAFTLFAADELMNVASIERLISQKIERRKLEGFSYKYTTALDDEDRARAILTGRKKKKRR